MKIDHIAVYCIDMEGVKNFFTRFFDAQSNQLYVNPKTGLKAYFLQFPEGGARLEIMNRPETLKKDREMFEAGYAHVCVSVGSAEQVDLITRKLEDNGYQVISGPRVTGDGYYESCVKGPEDLLVEITV